MVTSLDQLLSPVTNGLRVFCFPTVTGWVCIDFKMLQVMPGWLYVVPAGHCIWGATELLRNCLWTEIEEELPEGAQHCLKSLLFASEKRVSLPAKKPVSLETTAIMDVLLKAGAAVPIVPQTFAQKKATLQFYHELAEAFCRQIKEWGGDEKQKSVPELAASLYQQERTLRRACVATYGMPPVEMQLYQKAFLGARLLVETDLNLANIAHYLGFESESHCSRFLKGKMGVCPMVFRQWAWGLRKNG